MKKFALITAASLMAAPVFAEGHATGDAEAGGEAFNRQCVACHVVENDEGEIIAGRKARNGPNLYGVSGRLIGSVEGFKYGKSIPKLGEDGVVWDEEKFVGYVQDPTKWLRKELDNKRARGKMAFKVKKEEDALNLYAYLVSIGPAEKMMDKDADAETTESN